MTRILTFLCSFLSVVFAYAQNYEDYIGAGHAEGITVTSSGSTDETAADNTINGNGMDAAKMEAARFLYQAGFGSSLEDVNEVLTMGYEAWIDQQIALPQTQYLDDLLSTWDYIRNVYLSSGYYEEEDLFGPAQVHWNYVWWDNVMTEPDQLRQKIAFALSQLIVISGNNTDLSGHGEALSSYYDLLMKHAFGNYEDLLYDVSLNMSMGFYLSHLNNPKADPENNIHPDENFAREIMQLFSIGVYELNMDGSLKTNNLGQPIETYDLNDIRELAKVFTGLGPGGITDMVDWTDEPYFGLGIYGGDNTVPMRMYEEWHETEAKTMFGGQHTIPANQPGLVDIEQAVSILFNHNNTAPFVSRSLIQRLIKSNPSPQYIQRVAEVFVDNGEGVRGDMAAVVKAILLDDEARTCASWSEDNNGMLKEPVLRLTQLLKAANISLNELPNYWHNSYDFANDLDQSPLYSPSVFNFYEPDYKFDGNLNGPEFQILNTVTTANYFNMVRNWTQWSYITADWERDYLFDEELDEDVRIFGYNHTHINEEWVVDKLETIGMEDFMNELDVLLTHGNLSDEMRQTIKEGSEMFNWGTYQRAMYMFYFILVSPDFMILK